MNAEERELVKALLVELQDKRDRRSPVYTENLEILLETMENGLNQLLGSWVQIDTSELDEVVLVCGYCQHEVDERHGCCGEMHWEEMTRSEYNAISE